jgi:hypothetical protein
MACPLTKSTNREEYGRSVERRPWGAGPVYQGRFKSFPIQEDEHLLTVLSYVERNALRAANGVDRAGRQTLLWPAFCRMGCHSCEESHDGSGFIAAFEKFAIYVGAEGTPPYRTPNQRG